MCVYKRDGKNRAINLAYPSYPRRNKLMYKLSEIITNGMTNQQKNSEGKYIPARWLELNDGSLLNRIKNAWLVLKGKGYAVEWD
jgi:hypothetical protein